MTFFHKTSSRGSHIISSKCDLLPKVSSPNAISLGVRIPMYEFKGGAPSSPCKDYSLSYKCKKNNAAVLQKYIFRI